MGARLPRTASSVQNSNPNSDSQSLSPPDSDHSRNSTSPDDNNQPTPEPGFLEDKPHLSGEKQRVPKHKRQGRVVNALRQQYSIATWNSSQSALDIGPSSTSSLLSTPTLQAALNFHLVHEALATLEFVSNAGWHNISDTLTDVRLLGSKRADLYLETLVACCAALGARTSSHSAITGLTRAEMDAASPDEVLEFGLGKRREAACVALANRAMEMANSGGLLRGGGPQARALGAFMRAIFTCLMPAHPHARSLTLAIQSQLYAHTASQPPTKDSKIYLFYDASTSYTLRERPVCPDSDLPRLGGLPSAEELLAGGFHAAELSFDQLMTTWSDVSVVVLRKLCAVQLSKPLSTAELEPTFTTLCRLGDMLLAMLPSVVQYCGDEALAARSLAVMKLTTQVEVAIFSQAKRHVKGRNIALWNMHLVRFAAYLASLIRAITRDNHNQTALHLAANQFMALGAVPEWPDIVVGAAVQHTAAEGPLAAARLTMLDLAPLHRALRQGATIYAALAGTEMDLVHALEEHGISSPRRKRWPAGEERDLPEFLVHRAVQDILAN